MGSRLSVILLVLALLGQSWVVTAPSWLIAGGSDVTHAALHWNDSGHHHDEDGSVHQDDSADSVRHVVADAGLHAAAWATTAAWSVGRRASSKPAVRDDTFRPPPFIDGPNRPPRLRP